MCSGVYFGFYFTLPVMTNDSEHFYLYPFVTGISSMVKWVFFLFKYFIILLGCFLVFEF